nr:hypothetical protein HUO10_005891 [Paraburkholderia busanensis]
MPISSYASKDKAAHARHEVDVSDMDDFEDMDDDTPEFVDCEAPACGAPAWPMPPGDPIIVPPAKPAGVGHAIPASVEQFASQFATFGAWNYEGGDLVPLVLTRLPGWQAAGVTLQIVQDGMPVQTFGPDARSADDARNDTADAGKVITVRRINDCHYVPVVDGRDIDQGADGNCLFYSVWFALARTLPAATLLKLYEGRLPGDKFDAARYFRRAGARYIREESTYFADFLVSEHAEVFDEDEWFDARETFDVNEPAGARETVKADATSAAAQKPLDADEPSTIKDETLNPPPFSMTEIAKAVLVLVGSTATGKLFGFGLSLATSALPYVANRLFWIGYLLYQAFESATHGAYVDAFLDAVLAVPFELLSAGTLTTCLAESALAVLKHYAPWLLSTLNALSFTLEMNVVNIFACVLIAAIYRFVIEKRIAIHNGSYAQSIVRLVQRLQKVSSIYRAVEEQLMRLNEIDRQVRLEKAERHEILKWAKEKFGTGYVRALNLATNADPTASLVALRNMLESPPTSVVVASPPVPVPVPVPEPGTYATSAGESKVLSPLLPVVVTTTALAVAQPTLLATAVNLFEAIALALVSPIRAKSGRPGFLMALAGIVASILTGAYWLITSLWSSNDRGDFNGALSERVAAWSEFEQIESKVARAEYDPIPWDADNPSDPAPAPAPVRAKRSAEVKSDWQGAGNFRKEFIRQKIKTFNKFHFNETVTNFILTGELVTNRNTYSEGFLEAWQIFSDALRNALIIKNLPENVRDYIGGENLFDLLRDNRMDVRGIAAEEAGKLSSQNYFSGDLGRAGQDENKLNDVLDKIFFFEIFRTKISGGIKEFPYLEEIFSLKLPEFNVENFPLYLSAIHAGAWNLTATADDYFSRAVLGGENAFADIFKKYFSGDGLTGAAILSEIKNSKTIAREISTKLNSINSEIAWSKRVLYVNMSPTDSGHTASLNGYVENVVFLYTFLLSIPNAISYLEILAQAEGTPAESIVLSNYKARKPHDKFYVATWDAMAESMRQWLSRHPDGTYGDGAGFTPDRYLEIFREMTSNPRGKNRVELLLSALALFKLSSGVSQKDLPKQAATVLSNMKVMADSAQNHPFNERMIDKSARQGLDFMKNIKPNTETGDAAYYEQFQKAKAFTTPVAKLITAVEFSQAIPEYFFATSDPYEITVFNFYAIQNAASGADLDDVLGAGGSQKNIKNDRPPTVQQKYDGNILCIKYINAEGPGMIVISTLLDKIVVKFFDKLEFSSETLHDLFSTSNEVAREKSKKLIEWENGYLLPRGTDRSIMGKSLREGLLIPLFGDAEKGYSIGGMPTHGGYLVYDDATSVSMKNSSAFDVADRFFAESIGRTLDNMKAHHYTRPWWQYITIWMPFVDSLYFRFMDPDFGQEPRQLLFDLIDLFSTGAGIFKSIKPLRQLFIKNLLSKIIGKPMLVDVNVSTGKALLAAKDILFFWVPTGMLPIKISGELADLGKLHLSFDYAILNFSENNNVHWLNTMDNVLLLLNVDSFFYGYSGKTGPDIVTDDEIKDFFDLILSNKPVSSFIGPEYEKAVEKFRGDLLEAFTDRFVIKYEFVDDNFIVRSDGYAFYMAAGDSAYVVDPGANARASGVSTAGQWKDALMKRAGYMRIRANKFPDLEKAKLADLSSAQELPVSIKKIFGKLGEIFYVRGRKYYITSANDTLSSVASRIYGDASRRDLFLGHLDNHPVLIDAGFDGSLPQGNILVVPYIELDKFIEPENISLILSDVHLPFGFRYDSQFVYSMFSQKNVIWDLPEREDGFDVPNGGTYTDGGARFYVTDLDDDFEGISNKFYGVGFLGEKIKIWNMDKYDYNITYKIHAGMQIAVPWMFLAMPEQAAITVTRPEKFPFLQPSILKYEFVDCRTKDISTEKYVDMLEMAGGRQYIVEGDKINGKAAATVVSGKSNWLSGAKALNAGSRMILQEFSTADDARRFKLPGAAMVASRMFENQGETISINGNQFYKAGIGDDFVSLAQKFYNDSSMTWLLSSTPPNKAAVEDTQFGLSIACGTVIKIPKLEVNYLERLKSVGVVFSAQRLKNNLRYDGLAVAREYGANTIPGPASVAMAESGVSAKNGEVFYDSGERQYKVKDKDTLKSISKIFYGDERWYEKIAAWNTDLNGAKKTPDMRPGRKIKVPYAYWAVKCGVACAGETTTVESPRFIKYEYLFWNSMTPGPLYAVIFFVGFYGGYVVDENIADWRGDAKPFHSWLNYLETLPQIEGGGHFYSYYIDDDMDVAKRRDVSPIQGKKLNDFSVIVPNGRDFQFGGQKFYKLKKGDSFENLAKFFYKYESVSNFLLLPEINVKVRDNCERGVEGVNSALVHYCRLRPGSVISLPYLNWFEITGAKPVKVILSAIYLENGFNYAGWVVKSVISGRFAQEINEKTAQKDSSGQVLPGTLFIRNDVRFYKVASGDTPWNIIQRFYKKPDGVDSMKWFTAVSGRPLSSVARGGKVWLHTGDEMALPYAFLAE